MGLADASPSGRGTRLRTRLRVRGGRNSGELPLVWTDEGSTTTRSGNPLATGALESMWGLLASSCPAQHRRASWQHEPSARSREIEGRDSVGLYLDEIARTPLLDAATEVELSKTIEAGLFAEHLLAEGRVGRKKGGAPMTATEAELEWLAEEGRKAVTPVHQRQPAAGRVDRPQVRPRPDADARPDPGGQHRPDPGGREVRLRQGLQVLDVRHLVGASGDHPRHRAAGPRRPAARARRRGAQPGRRCPPHAGAPARP